MRHNYCVTVQAEPTINETEVRNIRVLRDGTSKIVIPNKYVLKLEYKHRDELVIILYNDKLMILNKENYLRVKPQKDAKIKRTTLSGYQTKRSFVYQVFITKEFIKDLKIEKDTPVTIYLKEYGLIISKYE